MTENSQDQSSETGEAARNRWVGEVQDALDRTGDAIRTAWDATRESRMSALESAKQAASDLSEVLDKGIAAAKERWASSEPADEGAGPEGRAADEAAVETAADTVPTDESQDQI